MITFEYKHYLFIMTDSAVPCAITTTLEEFLDFLIECNTMVEGQYRFDVIRGTQAYRISQTPEERGLWEIA